MTYERGEVLDDFVHSLKSLCPDCEINVEGPEQGMARVSLGKQPVLFLFHFLPALEGKEPGWQFPEPEMGERYPASDSRSPRFSGIRIWEDQWIRHREVVLGRVAALMGLATRHYARLTVVKRVHRPDAMTFLEDNHLLVPVPGKYRYGIYKADNSLLCLAVFSGARDVAGSRSFELLRFCSYRGHLVTGGLSKLLSAFIRHFKPGDIMTYIDLDWSDGGSFKKLGFREEGCTAPQVFWIHPGEMTRYYPHRLPAHLKDMDAAELHKAGYYRICNSGSLKMRLIC